MVYATAALSLYQFTNLLGCFAATDVDSAVEACAFFSYKLERMDVAVDMRFLSKLYLVASEDVTFDCSINLDIACMDVAITLSAWDEMDLTWAVNAASE